MSVSSGNVARSFVFRPQENGSQTSAERTDFPVAVRVECSQVESDSAELSPGSVLAPW